MPAHTHCLLYLSGQSSSATAEYVGLLAEPLAQIGQQIAENGLNSFCGYKMQERKADHPVGELINVRFTSLRSCS